MSAITHNSATGGVLADIPARPARTSLFKRAFQRLIEARMRKADELIHQHRHLMPRDLEAQAGWKINERTEGSLPFIR